ncbi:hypothetical protein C8A05DRAFT_18386 [Staphylotrichum tortipilum]|uniref:Uncharacterized protein n=1 Tax=Staphylotrichum tortipilum TaxID=2831512 RepID=A0AAN6ME31_9PEZI|nr:hypothetical protein C8A05DRAFT_18386 [Staphylotrichum longicolle]
MSSTATTTTTQSVTSYPLRAVLADYELHISEPRTASAASPGASSQPRVQNPPGWSQDHRSVPPYRPINRDLDRDQIMVYQNNVERTFVTTMFFGIRVVTAAHRTWCATGGKINDRLFRYEVGGEY